MKPKGLINIDGTILIETSKIDSIKIESDDENRYICFGNITCDSYNIVELPWMKHIDTSELISLINLIIHNWDEENYPHSLMDILRLVTSIYCKMKLQDEIQLPSDTLCISRNWSDLFHDYNTMRYACTWKYEKDEQTNLLWPTEISTKHNDIVIGSQDDFKKHMLNYPEYIDEVNESKKLVLKYFTTLKLACLDDTTRYFQI